jgi:uncharacterized membrane protein YqjE
MEQGEAQRHGVFETVRRLAATVLAILHNRLELVVVELEQERLRLFDALLLAAVVVTLGFFTLATAVVAVLIVVWDKYGVNGLMAASGLGLVCTLFAYWRLRARLKNWTLLSSTMAELKKDRECLERKS